MTKDHKSKKYLYTNTAGFTLIELLVVVAILAVLLSFVFVWLDPFRLLAEGRNSRRWKDINNISTAVHTFLVDYSRLPAGVDEKERQLGTAPRDCNEVCGSTEQECLDLSEELEEYLKHIPEDPLKDNGGKTFYSIKADKHGIITIRACNAENGEVIRISR